MPSLDWDDRIAYFSKELGAKFIINTINTFNPEIIGCYSQSVIANTQFVLKREFGVNSEIADKTLVFVVIKQNLKFFKSFRYILLGAYVQAKTINNVQKLY